MADLSHYKYFTNSVSKSWINGLVTYLPISLLETKQSCRENGGGQREIRKLPSAKLGSMEIL